MLGESKWNFFDPEQIGTQSKREVRIRGPVDSGEFGSQVAFGKLKHGDLFKFLCTSNTPKGKESPTFKKIDHSLSLESEGGDPRGPNFSDMNGAPCGWIPSTTPVIPVK